MIFLYDEQIIAAIYVLKNWKHFAGPFIDALYYSDTTRRLTLSNIVWLAPVKIGRLERVAKTYPEYFEYKNNTFSCKKTPEETYDAFLAAIPQEIQNLVASSLAPSLN